MPFFALGDTKLSTLRFAVPAACKPFTCDSGSSTKPHLNGENTWHQFNMQPCVENSGVRRIFKGNI